MVQGSGMSTAARFHRKTNPLQPLYLGRSRAGNPAETTHDQPSRTSTTSSESRGKRAVVSTHRPRAYN